MDSMYRTVIHNRKIASVSVNGYETRSDYFGMCRDETWVIMFGDVGVMIDTYKGWTDLKLPKIIQGDIRDVIVWKNNELVYSVKESISNFNLVFRDDMKYGCNDVSLSYKKQGDDMVLSVKELFVTERVFEGDN